jgi:hypothetical protein
MTKVKIGDKLLIIEDSDYRIVRIVSLADHVAFIKVDGDMETVPLRDIETRLHYSQMITLCYYETLKVVTGNTYISVVPRTCHLVRQH